MAKFNAEEARVQRAEGERRLRAEYRVMVLVDESKEMERQYLAEQERKVQELRAWVRPKP